jgi:PHP family Zn ribbon phosphoesterase
MIKLSYDLHIHSCLSPCGDDDMTPGNIIGMSALKNLDVIAVTDHNSCKNCPAVLAMARQYGIIAIPGMELCTSEEVHVLCLFAELKNALCFDEYVYSKLIKISNDEKVFGKQEIYDETDRVVSTEPYLLINAVDISFDSLGELIRKFEGIYIPAHLDKNSNSLLYNLGFIPPESDFQCAELKDINRLNELRNANQYLASCNIITDSDAHSLEQINEPVNYLYAESRNTQDILKALISNEDDQELHTTGW